MNKKILITGGPSNEYIDEVMKITNMSSGRIATELALEFLTDWNEVTLLITKGVKGPNIDVLQKSPKARVVRFETTEELYNALKAESEKEHYDVVIHSAAVADYKPEFSFRAEDMAEELTHKVKIKKDTLLFDILKQEEIMVNSFHNYHALENNLFNVCAISEDNIIEGIELNDKKFVLGIQWHPEISYEFDLNSKKIIDEFIRRC